VDENARNDPPVAGLNAVDDLAVPLTSDASIRALAIHRVRKKVGGTRDGTASAMFCP